MPKNLTTSQKTEIAKSELKTRLLITIQLDTPIRILENDTIAVMTINGNDYIGAFVKRSDVQTHMDNTVERVDVTISNVLQQISAIIASSGDVITNKYCKIEEVIFDGDSNTIIDDPVLIFDGLINTIKLTAETFSFDIERKMGGYNTVSPNMTYDVNCQFAFKDSRCGYSGGETVCDKTLKRCQALSNVTRFGGFPSIPIEMKVRT